MKKMEYRRPTADLILFENEDIIMTSGGSTITGYHKGNGHWFWYDEYGNLVDHKWHNIVTGEWHDFGATGDMGGWSYPEDFGPNSEHWGEYPDGNYGGY